MNKIRQKYLEIYFLTALKFIRENSVIKSYIDFLKYFLNENEIEKDLENYSFFVSELNKNNTDLAEYIRNLILKNEIFVSDFELIKKELKILKNFLTIDYETIKNCLIEKYPENKKIFSDLPHFDISEFKITIKQLKLLKNSANIFENNRTFIFDNDLKIKPVNYQEKLSFKDLKGYKEQKRILYENTKSLLEGKKVNNILLYGDAGCGKSSSVRALLSEFKEIKIIQIQKNNLINLDKLYLQLSDSEHKFIIFADDISFDEQDNSLSTMKAVLEGSLIQCPKNSVIYATSNRRHLIKESFQSRKGDEIHLNDTLNEISSLSERFGINLLFQKPSNQEFIEIVKLLAKDYNIKKNEYELVKEAQKLALIKGSNSPRIARQFIDNILAEVHIG